MCAQFAVRILKIGKRLHNTYVEEMPSNQNISELEYNIQKFSSIFLF